MAQYKVPIHFSRKMILFFYFYQKTFIRLKWTNALRCSHSFFTYFFWVSSKIKIEGEIDILTLKKRMRVRIV